MNRSMDACVLIPALAGLIVVGFAQPAIAQNVPSSPAPVSYSFPMAGIVPGEVFHLTVVNRSGTPSELPPDVCRVEIHFLNASGIVLAERWIENLEAGHASSLDYVLPLLTVARNRFELRAFVRVLRPVGSLLPPDVCKPSLEMYQVATGATRVYSSPSEPDLPAVQ